MLFMILAIAFSTNVATPLFPLYQRTFGLNTAMITLLFAVYSFGVLAMLLIGGTLAERVGPRPIALLGTLLAILSSLLFLFSRSAIQLFAARLLGGIAVGMFMGTSNTLLLNMTSPARRARIMGLSSTLSLFGFGLGPILGGLWIQYLPDNPTKGPFVVLLAALVAALVSLLSLSTPVGRGTAPTPFAIRLGIPEAGKTLFWRAVGPAIFTGFGFAGIAFTLLPGLARSTFGSSDPGMGGILIFLMTTSGAAAQLLPRPRSSRVRLVWGLALLALGSWVVIYGESVRQPLLMLAAIVVQGIGNGWTFQASLRLAGDVAVQGDRIRVMSTYFLCAYLGLSMPVLATGALSLDLGVLPSIVVMGVLLTGVLLMALLVARRTPLEREPAATAD